MYFPKCNESIFFANFFAVKSKSFYRHCLVKLFNKSIYSECAVFCISKLSCCLLFSLSWISSALTSPDKWWDLCMGEILDTCFTPATTNNHRSNLSPPLLAGDGCCSKESARMGGQNGSRTSSPEKKVQSYSLKRPPAKRYKRDCLFGSVWLNIR